MRAVLYVGGQVWPDNITEKPKEEDLVIAADSGYKNAVKCGVKKVDILLGDMDSIGPYEPPEGAELMQVPAEKDVTDTQLAVDVALERGATEIVIIGGLDGRLDHTMANLGVLEMLESRHAYALIDSGKNRVRILRNNSTLIARSRYKYLSLLCIDEKCKGVCVDGCKYPLKNATLTRVNQGLGVSNELTGNCALIAVRKGGLFIIESMD